MESWKFLTDNKKVGGLRQLFSAVAELPTHTVVLKKTFRGLLGVSLLSSQSGSTVTLTRVTCNGEDTH